MDIDRCICCGAPIPEGRMICWQCEHGNTPNKLEEALLMEVENMDVEKLELINRHQGEPTPEQMQQVCDRLERNRRADSSRKEAADDPGTGYHGWQRALYRKFTHGREL